jgi:hypothetical protein
MSHIHVVAHTHWDQEWYFTLQDSNILASYNFAEVIATLEQDPSYTCYHLDGQMAVVEDFLGINPEYRQRLNTLVRDKRLFIGPWYSQTDTYNVHGESIIRNLKYGMLSAREHGHAMMVGYLPDTFGHNAQMPTLLRGCGIDNIVFWRGINHDDQASKSQFIWRAPSGAEIIACAMAFGYGAAKISAPMLNTCMAKFTRSSMRFASAPGWNIYYCPAAAIRSISILIYPAFCARRASTHQKMTSTGSARWSTTSGSCDSGKAVLSAGKVN